ncbi:MAG TPA: metallophosphoesterase family protein [Thermoanaerobaculia bacterium]|nr:metallophosphoesterase family protein [Thermoanaerobaculia bacterium]
MNGAWVLAAAAAAFLSGAPVRGATDRPIAPVGGKLAPISAGADLLFVVGGDNRSTGRDALLPRVIRTIFSEIGLIGPNFVLWTGDTVYGYHDTARELAIEYDRFAAAARESGAPVFNAPGNHEIHHLHGDPCGDRASEEAYARRFGNLYGSFDAGDVHFIALDTAQVCSEDRLDPAQRAWLERDLAANKNARAIFVFTHSVFFAPPLIDPGSEKPEIGNRADLVALLRRYPVRAVFSGHAHLYSHEAHDGIDYFIAGGAGAPLYAPPDRGGFSHYVVVRLAGNDLRWDLVEPGRLYVETGRDLAGARTTWIVNGTDADVPLRGAWIDAPGPLGSCRRLAAAARLKKSDGTAVPVPAFVEGCAVVNGRRRARVALTSPRGTSVRVTIGRTR